MLINRRLKGIKVKEHWFQYPENGKGLFVIVNNLYEMCSSDLQEISREKRCTLTNDLTLPEEELLQNIDKNVRYEIRRAGKENVACKTFGLGDAGISQVIDEFDQAYREMYRLKGLSVKSVGKYLREIGERGIISIAYLENRPVVYHVYIVGEGIARLLYSVSVFRECDSNNDRSAIARGNRYLHWNDMVLFKEQGFQIYDWGGYSTDPELENISKFKAGFGGIMKDTYYATLSGSRLLAILYRKMRG